MNRSGQLKKANEEIQLGEGGEERDEKGEESTTVNQPPPKALRQGRIQVPIGEGFNKRTMV